MIDTLDLACVELQAISDDIVSGCKAYHNARVVVRYYNRYGYTEHFRELIGEENLVDQAKEVIRKFIRWIKQKLSELIDKVSSILREIKDKLAHMLGLKKTPDDLDSIVKQIDRRFDRSLTRRRETIAITFDTVRILSVTRSAALDLYVNYRLYKKQLLSGEYHEFLLTIVHECRHLFTSQQGLKYESDQAEEDTADTAEDAYVVQPDDISWAKDVVKKIKEQENA